MKSTHGVAERTLEPQTFEIDDLLRVGKSRWVSCHHVRYNRRRARRLDVVRDEDTNACYLTYLAIQHSIRLGCGDKARVLKQQAFHPRRHDDKASPGRKVHLVHEYGEVDELLIDVRRGELRGLDGVIRR